MNRRLRRKNRKRNDLVQHLSGSATPCFELLNAKDAKEDHAESRQVGVVSSQLAKPLHCFARTFASFALKVLSTLHLTEVARQSSEKDSCLNKVQNVNKKDRTYDETCSTRL